MKWRLIEVGVSNKENEEISSKDFATGPEHYPNIDHILNIKFSELESHNLGIKIYSDIVGSEVWLCTNDSIAFQVKHDDPGSVIYTLDELKRLIQDKVSSDDLKKIHDAKTVFSNSKIKSFKSTYNNNEMPTESEKN